jgi:Xaa-Pro aminopeptidase
MHDLSSPLPEMDVASRLSKLRERFSDLEVDALLVTNLVNVRYLTGFTGSAAFLLVTEDRALLTTDGRYKFQSVEQVDAVKADVSVEVGGAKEQKEALVSLASPIMRLGLEAGNVTWSQQRRFGDDWFKAELIPTENAVEVLRKTKDNGEVARIARACHTFALDTEIRRLGAEGTSFDTIVASGPNGAKAHHFPSSRVIGKGELIVLDFGSKVDGYCSDMTRTLCVGEPSSAEQQKMYDVVFESQSAGTELASPNVTCGDVDNACRKVIADAGWADAFLHSTGHGVGLDIHEQPWIAASQDEQLGVGYVVTVEPGVYLSDQGGVRIEDTVVINETGCEILTEYPKSLLVTG